MRQLTRTTLRGTWGTVLLPLRGDDSIDEAALEAELDVLLAAGLGGVYTNGSAGEFLSQTEAEFDWLSERVARRCHRAGLPFQLGACHTSPPLTLARVARARSHGPGAIQVVLPDWLPLNAAEQVDFLRRIADVAHPLPLVLYHPPHAKTKLSPADWRRLVEHVPELVGIKVGSGDVVWHEAMRPLAGHLAVFVTGHRLATGRAEGVAAGSYSNVACLSPAGAIHWENLMAADPAEARRVEERLGIFFQQCILPFHQAGYADPALDKLLAAVGGWCPVGTRLRWPYRGVDPSELPALRRAARQCLPGFFFMQ